MATSRIQRSSRSNLPALRRALFGAALGLVALHGTAWATNDLTIVVPTCSPANANTVAFGLTSKSGGYVRAGRNPPVRYFCPVGNPDDFTTLPSWTKLKLQYLDPNSTGGQVRASLYAKDRTTGATQLVASLGSVPSPTIKVVETGFRVPMDFAANGYYVVIDLNTTSMVVEAHLVMLTN